MSARVILLLASLRFLSAEEAANPTPPPLQLQGNTLTTSRHIITISPAGLPEQLVIKPVQTELPLEKRNPKAQVSTEELRIIGRGPQLRSAIRIETKAKGQIAVARPQAAAQPQLIDETVLAALKLKAGPVSISLEVRYEQDGAMFVNMIPRGGKVDSLDLVIELDGRVDTVVAGEPVATDLQAYPNSHFALSSEEGLVWGNSIEDAKKNNGRAAPGAIQHLFVGNGDRGFTFLSDIKGWVTDKKVSTSTLERNKAGLVTWRIRFINKSSRLKGQKLSFALLTHPSGTKPAGSRKQGWLDWPLGKLPERKRQSLSLKSRHDAGGFKKDIFRADRATAFESLATSSVLDGLAGGMAISAEQDHVFTYPISLFRYLSGTHTGLPVRLKSNSSKLIRAGQNRSPDRVLLGRALLHDIGLDTSRLAHFNDVLGIVKALHSFGYFAADGKTEFIPYWRTKDILRFGEAFSKDDAFSLTKTNPVAQVYLSVYRRPAATRGSAAKVMFVLVNESDRPVRDQLYVLNPRRLFGGPNRLTEKAVTSRYDFTAFPDRSDWAKVGMVSARRYQGLAALQDLEDNGVVSQASNRGGIETYGPMIFIRAHSFRLLFGSGRR